MKDYGLSLGQVLMICDRVKDLVKKDPFLGLESSTSRALPGLGITPLG